MKSLVAVALSVAAFVGNAAVRPVRVDWSPYPFVVGEFLPDSSNAVSIADYGAKPDGSKSTDAINRAIAECSAKGGGRVLVPSGIWTTGALVLKSGVELHLAADAVLAFAEGPDDYPLLPSPKGYDERNGKRPAPFIRADGATNIAITGRGELRGNVKYWFRRDRLGHSRPGFVWFDSCRNILISDVKIRQSAFWTIHTRLCTDVVLRRLDVECVRDIAHTYTNTDGVDIDSCSKVLIEDCTFDQDDDVICMKSGKNETGRRLGVPTEFVAVRRCTARRGHGLLAAGSELSGGIRNIYMTDCHVDGEVDFFLRIKTNRARGGFAHDITVENISGKRVKYETFRIETDYPESGGVKKPYFFTDIENITVRNLRCGSAHDGISLKGFAEHPARNVRVEDVAIGSVRKNLVRMNENVEGVVIENLRIAPGGWVDALHDRRIVPAVSPLWRAPVDDGLAGFVVDRLKGAEGTVVVSNGAIVVKKTNDRGSLVVKPAKPFAVARDRQVRASARVSCADAEPLKSVGMLCLFGSKEDFGLTKLDRLNFGAGGPRVNLLVNTPPGTDEIKFSHYQAWGSEGVATPAIVVGGMRSESAWRDWVVEDLDAAKKAWRRMADKTRPKDRMDEMVEESDFVAALAKDIDHSAKVEVRNGRPRLVVDGEVMPPVFFKCKNLGFVYDRGRYPFAGRRMARDARIDIQVANLPGALTHNYTNGVWTKDGYDAKRAVDAIRPALRIAPDAKFILSVPMMHFVEFGERHPDEVMRTKDGKIMYGNESVVYGVAPDFASIPDRRWAWASYSSEAFLAEGRKVLSALVAELRRTGISKRVIGFHICGFRDWQFGTPPDIDYSPASLKAYRERGSGRSYIEFVQREPTHVQNEFARVLKREMGKDVVTLRWCISAFSGGYAGSYDIGEFVDSDSLDILVAQPMYVDRSAGVPLGLRLPLASFRRHGKMFVNEFDLRTDLAFTAGGESEADAIGLGTAKGLDMWQSIFRRAAGQMIANGAGWWIFDMAGGWYESARIAADIGYARDFYRRAISVEGASPAVAAWKPGMAVLIDEQASLASVGGKEKRCDFNDCHVVLASSGVPYDQFLAADAIADGSILDPYRIVVWFGMRKASDEARKSLLARLASRGVRVMAHDELAASKGRRIFEVARAAGAYVPCDRYGLQVDMNGGFISLHCLIPGHYDFMLPFPAKVVNLKTGNAASTTDDGKVLPIDMVAGETRWYSLR